MYVYPKLKASEAGQGGYFPSCRARSICVWHDLSQLHSLAGNETLNDSILHALLKTITAAEGLLKINILFFKNAQVAIRSDQRNEWICGKVLKYAQLFFLWTKNILESNIFKLMSKDNSNWFAWNRSSNEGMTFQRP